MRTKKQGALLGEFFASVASPELLRFEKGDDETSWSLPATDLSPEKLMRFSLSAMGRKIASDGIRTDGSWAVVNGDMDVSNDNAKADAEGESEPGTEIRWNVSLVQLLGVVILLTRHILGSLGISGRLPFRAFHRACAIRSAVYVRLRAAFSSTRCTRKAVSYTLQSIAPVPAFPPLRPQKL